MFPGAQARLQLPRLSFCDSGYILLLCCHVVLMLDDLTSVFPTKIDESLSAAPGWISSGHFCVPSAGVVLGSQEGVCEVLKHA